MNTPFALRVSKQRLAYAILILLSVCIAIIVPLHGQTSSLWEIVKKLTATPQKAFYVDRDPKSKEPDTILKPPILEAVFFTDNENGWAVGEGGTIVRTYNGGLSWVTNIANPPGALKGIFFQNVLRGWAVGGYRGKGIILKTEDGGSTWHSQNGVEGFELSGFHDVWFTNEQNGWIVGEAQQKGIVQGIIISTQDGGASWHLNYLSGEKSSYLHSIRFADSKYGWAIGQSVVLHTKDSGQHWSEQHYSPDKDLFGIDFISLAEGWIVGSNGLLLYTTNGGETWQARQLPTEQSRLWFTSVRFINSAKGWIAGENGTILSTKDGGNTWESESNGTTKMLRKLASTSQSIFAVGNEGVVLRRKL
jgi:photosystem II stability/assembly factor-like uncharacterized protein